MLPDRQKLPLQFDRSLLQANLAQLEQIAWTDHFVPQHYEGSWSVIPLRAPEGAQHPIQMIYSDPGGSSFVDTPWLAHCPYFQQVIATFQCRVDAVRLMKLTPGSVIKEHRDHDLAFEYGAARLHIPVTTNPDVAFILNGEPVVMQEGECWYLRLSDPHAVMNHGQTDRVHLVIDTQVNEWLAGLMMSSQAA